MWTYDDVPSSVLETMLDVPRLEFFESTTSTMDEAHALANAGAQAGTVVLAERQEAGRGRGGHRWVSEPGQGIWVTLIERPNDARALDVLSIRVGLRAARALDEFVSQGPVGLKWPNDLVVRDGKLGGILIEARWRADRIDWVSIGIGINVRRPTRVEGAASIGRPANRFVILRELVRATREAAAARGPLTGTELEEFARRDIARGRTSVEPAPGEVIGINESGALLVKTAEGVRAFRDGSLTFAGAIA